MKILFVTNLPSPYRIDFFNELAKKCELTVCYELKNSTERDKKWINKTKRNFNEIQCNCLRFRKDRSFSFKLIKIIKKNKFDYLIISGYSSPSVIFLINYCIFKKINYFLETDGGFFTKEKIIIKQIKKFLTKNSSGIFTTCDELIKYYEYLDCKNIYKYPLSSVKSDDILKESLSIYDKNCIKTKLNIKEKFIILSVGRFTYEKGYGKGFDQILNAAYLLEKAKIGWYIVADQPTAEFIKMKENLKLENVHFIPFMSKDDLANYYKISDIFVLMTKGDVWGMVINEAMSFGIPIITTTKCIAGLEMVKNYENGFIIDVGDYEELSKKIIYLLNSPDLINQIKINNLSKIKNWTIEKMAEKHIKVFETFNGGKYEKNNNFNV